MSISFVNDVGIQVILEFKDSLGKYHPVFPENPLNFFLGHTVYLCNYFITDVNYYI